MTTLLQSAKMHANDLGHACSRDRAVQLCMCCVCWRTVCTLRRLAGDFSPGNRNFPTVRKNHHWLDFEGSPIARLPMGFIPMR